MVNTLIFIYILICILYALWVSRVFKKMSQQRQQPGQNVQPQVQPVQTQQTGNKWLPIKVGGGILAAFLIIGFFSWVLNGETNYKLKEGKIYSVEIPFPKKFSVYGHGKKFYASIDGNNWRLVGDSLPRNDWGQRVNIYYFKYFEPETEVTIRLYR